MSEKFNNVITPVSLYNEVTKKCSEYSKVPFTGLFNKIERAINKRIKEPFLNFTIKKIIEKYYRNFEDPAMTMQFSVLFVEFLAFQMNLYNNSHILKNNVNINGGKPFEDFNDLFTFNKPILGLGPVSFNIETNLDLSVNRKIEHQNLEYLNIFLEGYFHNEDNIISSNYSRAKLKIDYNLNEIILERTIYDCISEIEAKTANIKEFKTFCVSNGELSNSNYLFSNDKKIEDEKKYKEVIYMFSKFLISNIEMVYYLL